MTLPEPYSTGDPKCFGYSTITDRFPKIFSQIKDDLTTAAQKADPEAQQEAKDICAKFQAILDGMAKNEVVGAISELEQPIDGVYNQTLKALEPLHYQDAPWLFVECLLYRRAQQFFQESKHWVGYDFFSDAKDSTFGKSEAAVGTLAARYVSVVEQIGSIKAQPLVQQLEILEVLFHEVLLSSLWGNATDLSLLVSIDLEQIKKLQVATAERDKTSLLANDFPGIWRQMRSSMGGRVDIVLDNAGFELYTDLILALFLLDTGLAEQIVLHPKDLPWFVSDVTPRDWMRTTELLSDNSVFVNNRSSIDTVIDKIHEYQSSGQIVMRTSSFWTMGGSFWDIVENGKYGGHELWQDMRASKLVFFKGDLNYRKLTGDVAWPRTTPFKTAIQGLASNGIPMATLRTVKSDVCVGLPEGKGEELDDKWGKDHEYANSWAWNGQYAVISFSQ